MPGSLTFFHNVYQRAHHLHIVGAGVYVPDLTQLCPVEITVRVVIEQVFESADPKLGAQEFTTLRPYALQVFDRRC